MKLNDKRAIGIVTKDCAVAICTAEAKILEPSIPIFECWQIRKAKDFKKVEK